MRTVAITVLCCVWVVVLLVVGIYTFDTPRTWMVRVLSAQKAPMAAVITANVMAGTATSSTVSDTASSSSSSTIVSAIAPRTTYEYKILDGATACKLSLLGADGWHPIQFGGTLLSGYDSSADCKKLGMADALDWVLLERPTVPAQ